MRRICIRPRFWLILMAAMALGFITSGALSLLRCRQLSAQAGALQTELDALRLQAQDMRKQLEFVQGDAYAERAARKELGMIYPGEIRYISD